MNPVSDPPDVNPRRLWVAVWGDAAADAAGAILGFVLAVALASVLNWSPPPGGPGFEVSPNPNTPAGWLVVGPLVVLVAAVTALGGDWLTCCWFPFPSFLVAYFHYFEAGSGTVVVTGPMNVAGLALAAAVVVGTTGYLLGVGGRWGYTRVGPAGPRRTS